VIVTVHVMPWYIHAHVKSIHTESIHCLLEMYTVHICGKYTVTQNNTACITPIGHSHLNDLGHPPYLHCGIA
jgi:hypothetical protein